jgi:hypothetical protein
VRVPEQRTQSTNKQANKKTNKAVAADKAPFKALQTADLRTK